MKTTIRNERRRKKTPIRPIYVLGGFLGSGKTTLLIRLLRQVRADGMVPAVIMNEYGARSIDGRLLQEHGGDEELTLEELVGGCVCCDLSQGLTDAVIKLLRSTSGPIFVETTGLAVVSQVAQAIEGALAREGAQPAARLQSVVVAVDVTRFSQVSELWKHTGSDLASADTVVLTKCDRASESAVARLAAALARRNPRARFLRSRNADVDPRALLVPPEQTRAARPARPPATTDSARGFASATCRILGPIDQDKLGPVLGRFAPALARVKGFVRTTGGNGLQTVQWVPGALEITPHRGGRIVPHLVIIAKGLDWNQFVDALDKTVAGATPRRRASEAAS